MDEISVMDGSKCILQVRGVRPFLSTKYDIEKHPNYKYLADADPKKAFDIVEHVKVFKENKAKLLAGLNKKNTNHILIEIGEDEADAEVTPTQNPVSAPIEPTEAERIITPPVQGEPTKNQNEIITDNDEDEDDSDDYDPDDTELV